MLGVSQPTLSAWEGERKNPSVESLIQMFELYGVSVDFLLGLPEARYHRADMLQPIPPEALPAFHDTPVFSSRYGWAMAVSYTHLGGGGLWDSAKYLIKVQIQSEGQPVLLIP